MQDGFKLGDLTNLLESLSDHTRIKVNGSENFKITIDCDEHGEPFVELTKKETA